MDLADIKHLWESDPSATLFEIAKVHNVPYPNLTEQELAQWRKKGSDIPFIDFECNPPPNQFLPQPLRLEIEEYVASMRAKHLAPAPVEVEVLPPLKPPTDKELAEMTAEAKQLIMAQVTHRLKLEVDDLSIKELKEITAIVEAIDKSTKNITEGNQINIVVQNLVNKYGG